MDRCDGSSTFVPASQASAGRIIRMRVVRRIMGPSMCHWTREGNNASPQEPYAFDRSGADAALASLSRQMT